MICNIVLDWAGTLADDVDLTLEATNHALTSLGGEAVDMTTYRRDFVIPVMDFYGPRLPGRTLREIDDAFFAWYADHADRLRLFDGVVELLHLARARRWRVFILSTVPTDVLEQATTALGIRPLFDGIEGGATDKRDVMPRLLERESLHADETIFLGDTVHDVETARASGVRAAAALYGYSLPDDLRAAAPDDAVESIDDLIGLLDKDHLFRSTPLVIATVGGLVVDPNHRLLMVRTRKWSGTWGIPGGKVDYGETLLDAYEREMLEETGLVVEDSRFVMIQDCIESTEFVEPRHFLLVNYLSRTQVPDLVRVNYEIAEWKWASLEEARALPLNRPTRSLLGEVERRGFLGGGFETGPESSRRIIGDTT